MILGILNKIWDVVGSYVIYEKDKDGNQRVVFRFNTIEECNYRSTSQVVSFPTETGILATDYKYQDMGVLVVKGVLERSSALGSAISALSGGVSSKTSLISNLDYYKSGLYALNIQTKTGLYENYTLQDFEIPENSDNYGIIEVFMTFKEITNIGSQPNVKKEDSNTVPAGIASLVGLS